MGGEPKARVQQCAKGVQPGATRMRGASSFAEFANDPHGRCISGGSFAYGWPTADLCVTALWGEPDPSDLETLAKLYALELAPPAGPHAAIIDTLRVEAVSEHAFGVIARYVQARREGLAEFVTRLAIVRRVGFVGAVAAGFFETIEAPYSVQAFDALPEALTWCEGPSWVERDLMRWVAECADVPDLVRDVRRAIESALPEPDAEAVAKSLGLTLRTLQRRLKEHETTFRQQVALTQVRVAQRWLEDTDESVTHIAYEVGCSSPQHLSTLFRQHAGTTPSAWRAEHQIE